jgi:V/A-type H+-transporting ATPase subunit C
MSMFDDDPYLNTRITLFARRMLPEAEYVRLPDYDLGELARHYALTALQEQDLGSSGIHLHLRALESALIRIVLDDLVVLVRPMSAEGRAFVMHWARKFELFNLKALIRGKLNELGDAEINANLYELPAYLALPHQALLRAETVLELLRLLEQGQYAYLANQVRHVYEAHREPFLLDAAIDQRYYANMVDLVADLSGTDREETLELVGLRLDRVNLLWMLRYRFTYGLSASETYLQLVPSPGALTRNRLLALLDLPTEEAVLAALPKSLAGEVAGAEGIIEIERRVRAKSYRELRFALAKGTSGIARAFAYLELRELELKRLFTVVQARLMRIEGDALRLALELPMLTGEVPASLSEASPDLSAPAAPQVH